MVQPCILWREGEGMENSGEIYITECLCLVNKNRIVSVMVWGSLATTVLAIWTFSMKTWCGKVWQNIVRKPYWFCRQHIWRQKSTIRVSTWQWSGPHGASNCRMAGAGHIHHSMAIQIPDLDDIDQVWDFMDRKIVRVMPATRNDLIRDLLNSCLNIIVA